MNVAPLAFVTTFGVGWEMHFWPACAAYVHAVLAHWAAISAGVAVLFVDALKWRGKQFKAPTWLKITVALSVFSVVQFLAYRDAMLAFERIKQEKADAMGESAMLKIEVAHQQARLEEKDNLIQSQQRLIDKNAIQPLTSRMANPCQACRQYTASSQPRLLDEKKENILVAMLQSVRATVEIQEPVNNDEASSYGTELVQVLGKAGWSFRRIKWVIPEGTVATGIVIRSKANSRPAAAELAKALSDLGVAVRQDVQADEQIDEGQIGSDDLIEVYVGPKP
jgi:hypothetical protein